MTRNVPGPTVLGPSTLVIARDGTMVHTDRNGGVASMKGKSACVLNLSRCWIHDRETRMIGRPD